MDVSDDKEEVDEEAVLVTTVGRGSCFAEGGSKKIRTAVREIGPLPSVCTGMRAKTSVKALGPARSGGPPCGGRQAAKTQHRSEFLIGL